MREYMQYLYEWSLFHLTILSSSIHFGANDKIMFMSGWSLL